MLGRASEGGDAAECEEGVALAARVALDRQIEPKSERGKSDPDQAARDEVGTHRPCVSLNAVQRSSEDGRVPLMVLTLSVCPKTTSGLSE